MEDLVINLRTIGKQFSDSFKQFKNNCIRKLSNITISKKPSRGLVVFFAVVIELVMIFFILWLFDYTE